jgi:phosphate/sulfate permease
MNKIIRIVLIVILSLIIGGVISFVIFKHTEKKACKKDYENILRTLSYERNLKDAFVRNITSYFSEHSDKLDEIAEGLNNYARRTILSVAFLDTVKKAIIEKDDSIFDSKYFKFLIDHATAEQGTGQLSPPLTDLLLSIDLDSPEDALLKIAVVENYFLYSFIWSYCFDTIMLPKF